MEGNTGMEPQHGGRMNGPPADGQAGTAAMAGAQGGQPLPAQGQPQMGGPMMSVGGAGNPPGQGGGTEESCSCSEHEPQAPAGSGQGSVPPGPSGTTGTYPGAMGSPGMNPGFTGPAGMQPGSTRSSGAPGMNPGSADMNAGQSGSQGAWHPGNPPYSPGAMGNPGPSAGPFSQPGQAPWSFPGPAQMGPQPGAYPGQGPEPPFPPHYTAGHNQPAHQPWSHPASGPQGFGPSTAPHMGHAAPVQGIGYMGADAPHIHHDENRFGQMADMVGRFLKGEATTTDMVNGLFSLNFRDDQFWKGALLGAVAVLIFNSDAVHQGLGKLFRSKSSDADAASAAAEKTA